MARQAEPAENQSAAAEHYSMRVPGYIATRLRVIGQHRDMTMPDVLEAFGGPGIEREYRKVLNEMSREVGGEG